MRGSRFDAVCRRADIVLLFRLTGCHDCTQSRIFFLGVFRVCLRENTRIIAFSAVDGRYAIADLPEFPLFDGGPNYEYSWYQSDSGA